MALTREFRDTVKARVTDDPAYRSALLAEAAQLLLSGDTASGRSILRDYINATVGFEKLAAEIGKPAKSLMRMFGPKGNPTAENLFRILSHLQKATGVRLAVHAAL